MPSQRSGSTPVGRSAEEPQSVSALTAAIRQTLERTFGRVSVVGEISNLARPRSGHVYLTLKDDKAQIRGVMWRSQAARVKFDLTDGMEVVVSGRLSVYAPRGEYQIAIDKIAPKGVGALELAFRQLQDKLRKQGLFDPEHKKPLPFLPGVIGMVTSPTGAAVHDMLEIIDRRFPRTHVLIAPVRVQGEGAAAEIAAAIGLMNTRPEVDVLIVGRGGGSLEDLWAFNEEPVARAIFASRVPVVSAVGHEVDVTISDLVADVRARTPSEAAELVVPRYDELVEHLGQQAGRLTAALRRRAVEARARLDVLASARAIRYPLERIRNLAQYVDDLAGRSAAGLQRRLDTARHRVELLGARRAWLAPAESVDVGRRRVEEAGARAIAALDRRVEGACHRLERQAGQLRSLNPLAVLERGYSITTAADDGRVLTRADDVAAGQEIVTRLHQGRLTSTVSAPPEDDVDAGP